MNGFISDTYRANRVGWSRVLKISCKSCYAFLFYYQKDGSGPLKRSYLDRIIGKKSLRVQKDLVFCPHCEACLGFNEPYVKENNRLAIRWAVEAVEGSITPINDIS